MVETAFDRWSLSRRAGGSYRRRTMTDRSPSPPATGELLITGALLSLVSLHRLAPWIAMVIIAREIAVTGLRAIAAERGIVIAASWLGKLKTVLQIAAVIALIAADPSPLWVDLLVYLALAVTVVSGADYFFGLRRRIEELERERAAAKAKPT